MVGLLEEAHVRFIRIAHKWHVGFGCRGALQSERSDVVLADVGILLPNSRRGRLRIRWQDGLAWIRR